MRAVTTPLTPPMIPPTLPSNTIQPPRKPLGFLGKCVAVLVIAVSTIALLNPTAGLIEALPDALPIIGNLDEAFFTLALISALGALGVRVPFLKAR